MLREKKKIVELDIKDSDKRMLGLLHKPRRLAEIAAKLDIGYTSAHQKLLILEAKKYITIIKTMRGKTLYKLHENIDL